MVLISVYAALSKTLAYTARPRTQGQWIAHSACTLPALLVLIGHTQKNGQAELTWVAGNTPRWFTHPRTFTHPSTNRVGHRATVLLLTETSVLALSQPNRHHTAVIFYVVF